LVSRLSTGVAAGEAWLAAAGEQQPWRRRAAQAFYTIKQQIDPREQALGALYQFTQQARKHETDMNEAEDAVHAAAAAPKEATGQTTVASSSAEANVAAALPAMPVPTEFVVSFVHPSRLTSSAVRHSLAGFASARLRFHSSRVLLFAALLPVTALATVLPGPNVFFAFAAFRLLGHYQAREGAKELDKLISAETADAQTKQQLQDTNKVEAVAGLAEADVAPVILQLQAYDEPLQNASEDGAEVIQDAYVTSLCRMLQLDLAEVQKALDRWRD